MPGQHKGKEWMARVFRRADRGLFAGKRTITGNKVSEDGGNKTRRTWKPNVQYKRLYSEALDRMIRLRVTTHAMRCIDNKGGLDRYILSLRPGKGELLAVAKDLKAQILAAQEKKKPELDKNQLVKAQLKAAKDAIDSTKA
mmetsp:Transcript_5759/g.6617  ORF Transcript_5759/g.6617 Transcript_5759/m.6617 type:complete len:141 (-) Transcript_5759:559-981(-)|eukprot:CAMPEP_0197850692 /NCGR_PEP_ID=MMETSP1438-20131217/16101_1 /TAXON_ID=1461541 /ORGANISM="Pterosperma sp., Strain CCMP1384" /LENGTH=140 /DNA_ID=CAMNT_0043463985 /DNA_START=184 /DNA_END=606 /DNA_ORIENTATION=+